MEIQVFEGLQVTYLVVENKRVAIFWERQLAVKSNSFLDKRLVVGKNIFLELRNTIFHQQNFQRNYFSGVIGERSTLGILLLVEDKKIVKKKTPIRS